MHMSWLASWYSPTRFLRILVGAVIYTTLDYRGAAWHDERSTSVTLYYVLCLLDLHGQIHVLNTPKMHLNADADAMLCYAMLCYAISYVMQ